MTDNYEFKGDDVSAPARRCIAVTPTDNDDLGVVTKAIFVGVQGDVSLVPVDNPDNVGVVFRNVPAGSWLPVRARRVRATGTTATNLIALLP
jgi:hypothetical protein